MRVYVAIKKGTTMDVQGVFTSNVAARRLVGDEGLVYGFELDTPLSPLEGGLSAATAQPGQDAARYVDTAEFKAGVLKALQDDPKFADAVKAFVMDGVIMGLLTSEFKEAVIKTVLDSFYVDNTRDRGLHLCRRKDK